MISKTEILAREKKWTLIAGIASVMGVAIILATFSGSAAAVRASAGLAEELIRVDGDRSGLWIASIGQFIGWALLAVPLVFLFKAAAARSSRVRGGLIGVMIVAPLLLGAGSLLSAGSVLQAATDFQAVDQATITSCVDEKIADADGEVSDAEREDFLTECRDDEASEIRSSTSLASIETGVGLAGLLGFTISIVYVSLWSMRTGLLSRFWGSLGIALGAVFAFFTLFTLVWFIYIGLLLAGWVPGGRPPAWRTGEAIPWLRPGEKASGDDDVIDGTADEIELSADELEPGEAEDFPDEPQGERRKRKKRG